VPGERLGDPFPAYRGKGTGTITGDKVRLMVTGDDTIDGLVVDGALGFRKGTLTLRSMDGKVDYVLTDPAGP
jgi:hypothetical protein